MKCLRTTLDIFKNQLPFSFFAALTSYFIVVVNSLYHQLDRRQVAPSEDSVTPIVFIIDPPPHLPPDPPPPPPYQNICELFPTTQLRLPQERKETCSQRRE
jgi:hypothetical protein